VARVSLPNGYVPAGDRAVLSVELVLPLHTVAKTTPTIEI
jgi:hypothetical protein